MKGLDHSRITGIYSGGTTSGVKKVDQKTQTWLVFSLSGKPKQGE